MVGRLPAGLAVACGSDVPGLPEEGAPGPQAAGQQLLLKIFEVLGPTHEITVAARKQLAGLLFR